MKSSVLHTFIKLWIFVIIISFFNVHFVWSQTISFPGAEGYGRFAKGGRGGDVYIVTNLNDSGKGSLRYGVENADGPRTIVFEVSGNIELKSHLEVNESYMTIAGQTAPGDGICLKDYGFKIMECHDVIVRYMRFRLGDENKTAPAGYDAIETNDVSNLIFDHVSASWGIDGTHDLRGELFTLQWSIYGEALNNSLHEKGTHAMLSSMRDVTDNLTMHHNLMHSSRDRHPSLGGGSLTKAETIIDFRNNLVFNWDGGTNLGSCKLNVINNYYKPGASTDLSDQPMTIKSDIGVGDPKGFTSGNVFPWNEVWTADNFLAINYENSGSYISTTREEWELPGELVFGDDKPVTHSAAEAYEMVLQYAGASLSRDSVDTRHVAGVRDGTGRLIDSQSEVGGFPELASLPAPADKDRDGMPDEWEAANGLDSLNAEDRNGDRNNDGYTNLEEYLYSLVPIHVNVAPVVKLLTPVSDTGFLQKDTVFVKAVAFDYGDGSIESLEIYLGEDLIISSDSGAVDTILTGLSTGVHYLVAKATDDSGRVAFDTSKFYIGAALYTLEIDSVIGDGSVTLDPPGGLYVEGMPVSLQATPDFPYYFEGWSGDSTSTENPLILTLNKDMGLTANFKMDSSSVLKINFQPETSDVPEGYFPDFGYQYGPRDNGQTYGWVGEDNFETRERSHEDLRKATLNHFQKSGDDVWEIQLENGIYSVYLHMGDADYTDQTNSLYVEGIQILDETSGNNFDEFYLTDVPVGDGNLTLTPIGPGVKINYIEISMLPANYLIVNRGSGSGEYDPGTIVNISADEPPTQYVFEEWTGDVSYLADPTASSTTLTMPEGVVTVTAVYRSTVGMADKSAQEKSIHCYPNPAGSSFTIDLEEIGESDIEIYNLLGRKVYHTETKERITSIHDHNMNSGIYLIRVTDQKRNVYQQRIIIEK